MKVSASGKVTTSGALSVNTYVASGTDSDGHGDAGTWTYSLHVTPVTITQAAPTSGTTSPTASSGFTGQLQATGYNGSLIFVTTASNPYLKVSSAGAVSTVGGPLAVGNYIVSGTDWDGLGDTGTWTYTLHVIPGAITQVTTVSGTTSTTASTAFTSQLNVTGNNGAVAFITTTSNAN